MDQEIKALEAEGEMPRFEQARKEQRLRGLQCASSASQQARADLAPADGPARTVGARH